MSDPIDYHKLKPHPLAELFLKYNEEDLTLQPYGRHLEIPPPLGVKEAEKVLIDQYGFDKVSDEVLEHTP
jgi:hypothetical protein